MNIKLLDISDLHVGMKVNTYELSKIFDTYILLSQTRLKDDGSTEGVIEFIGKKQTQEMLDEFNKQNQNSGNTSTTAPADCYTPECTAYIEHTYQGDGWICY